MALIKCPNCGTLVSNKAEACPVCGKSVHEIITELNGEDTPATPPMEAPVITEQPPVTPPAAPTAMPTAAPTEEKPASAKGNRKLLVALLIAILVLLVGLVIGGFLLLKRSHQPDLSKEHNYAGLYGYWKVEEGGNRIYKITPNKIYYADVVPGSKKSYLRAADNGDELDSYEFCEGRNYTDIYIGEVILGDGAFDLPGEFRIMNNQLYRVSYSTGDGNRLLKMKRIAGLRMDELLHPVEARGVYDSGSGGSWLPGRYPEGSTRYLSEYDLMGKSLWELKIMRNEIYARHHYIFKSSDLIEYFNRQSWYTGYDPDAKAVARTFNDYENKNVYFIREYERALKHQ